MAIFEGMGDWSPSSCQVSFCTDKEYEDEFAVVGKDCLFADKKLSDAAVNSTLLTDTSAYVRHLQDDPSMVDAVRFSKNMAGMNDVTEAKACRPMLLDMSLPKDHVRGHKIQITTPHGGFGMMPPDVAEPGDEMHYYLGPLPEFQIEVPPGYGQRCDLTIMRDDGSEVRVVIPENKRPGDVFGVEPPALMVLVPDGIIPGDCVRFRHGQSGKSNEVGWHWAKVPALLRPGGYFAARLPPREFFI